MGTIIYTGRPMRVLRTPYVNDWEVNKPQKIRELTSKGILPVQNEMTEMKKAGTEVTLETTLNMTPLLMGKCAGAVHEIKPAKEIMDEMVAGAIEQLQSATSYISKL